MQAEELRDLVDSIRRLKSESQTAELKAVRKGVPEKIHDTLSSFSNQDDGGVIVFGIDQNNDYDVCGVFDCQKVMENVTAQCKEMVPEVRALFSVCEIDGKMIVSAEIPGVDVSERPVFYGGVGRIKGSYIRVGDADEHMTEYEVYSYEVFKKSVRNDIRVIENVQMSLWDKECVSVYLNALKEGRPNLTEHVSDETLLETMHVVSDGKPTLAGLLTFHRFPQASFPGLCVIAVVVPGTEIGAEGFDGERFSDNVRITGSVQEMLDGAIEFVRRNSRTKTIIDENGHRVDVREYPLRAVREAVLNAIVHRDYSVYTERTPIRIEMYDDRMEIVNQGGLYGRTHPEFLSGGIDKGTPDTRNEALVGMLELLGVTENRYSGIPTIRKEFAKANLPAPSFTSIHGEFKVVFRNGFKRMTDAKESVLDFCEIPRSRDDIVAFLGKSQNYVMSDVVNPLVREGKLRLTCPDKPQSPKQKFVRTR